MFDGFVRLDDEGIIMFYVIGLLYFVDVVVVDCKVKDVVDLI